LFLFLILFYFFFFQFVEGKIKHFSMFGNSRSPFVAELRKSQWNLYSAFNSLSGRLAEMTKKAQK
jgi:hypothetical protein